MPSAHVIRIPRTDTTEGDDAFILGEVSPSGSKALNLKFVATEGEEPYVVKRECLPTEPSLPFLALQPARSHGRSSGSSGVGANMLYPFAVYGWL